MAVIETLLEITIYSTVIFAVIMLIKTFFRNKMSPFLHFALWSLFLIRLILPVTIESSVHLITLPAQTSMSNQEAVQDGQNDAFDFMTPSSNTYSKEQNALYWETSKREAQNTEHSSSAATTRIQTSGLTLPEILLIVWLGGVAGCLCYFAALAILLKRKLKKRTVAPSAHILTLVQQVKDELGIKLNIRLLCQDVCGTPALLFPRTIFLPMRTLAAMDDEQVKNCIRHECMHYKRGDQYTNLLLLILNAVYWFNPIVWLAFYQVRRDMETACDGAVVRRMDMSARRDYATLILGMFSQVRYGQIALGMIQGSTKKIAEQRIKGIFMRNKSGKSVRFLAVMLAAVLFVCCFTTACQPTPEKEFVVSKADGLPSQSLNAEINENIFLTLPEKWMVKEDLSDSMTMNVDATIERPDTNVFPVYKLQRKELTQEKLNELINYFAPNAQFYTAGVFTKEYYEQRLIEAKRGQFVDGKYVPPPADDPWVKSIEEKLANAPMTNEVIPIGTDFDYYSDYNGKIDKSRGKNFLYINFTSADGMSGSIFALKYDARNSIDNRFSISSNINFLEQSLMENQPKISEEERQFYTADEIKANDEVWKLLEDGFFDSFTITQSQAIEQANKIVADLGIESMGIVRAEKVLIKRYSGISGFSDAVAKDQGYVIEYTRKLDAIDGYVNHYSSSQHGIDYSEAYAPPFTMEGIVIVISESGVEHFSWDGMAQKTETVSENTNLLPFDEIKERIVSQLKYENPAYDGLDIAIELKLTNIRLASAYINVKDDISSVWHVPVWVAQGSRIYKNDEGIETFSLGDIVINALDGGRVHGQDIEMYSY